MYCAATTMYLSRCYTLSTWTSWSLGRHSDCLQGATALCGHCATAQSIVQAAKLFRVTAKVALHNRIICNGNKVLS